MFIEALFIIARTWKQPRCSSADEWIRKLWYIYIMEYYSAIKIIHLNLCEFLLGFFIGIAGFPGGSVVKNLLAYTGDTGFISGSGRSPGVENGNPLQYSFLEHSMDRGAWQAAVHAHIYL